MRTTTSPGPGTGVGASRSSTRSRPTYHTTRMSTHAPSAAMSRPGFAEGCSASGAAAR